LISPHGRHCATQYDGIVMRDILTEIFTNEPLDPSESARQGARPTLRKRFYARAHAGEPTDSGGYPLLLDGKPVRTPAKRMLAAPTRPLADRLADEWNAQVETVDPPRMPLTRLANVIIDALAPAPQPVIDEVAKFLGSDLICYRAATPEGLVERQAEAWDPVLAWAHQALGARFVQVEGVVFADQPTPAIAAARAAIPTEPWALGAVASVTTLTGSAILALALARGQIDVAAAWAAAHVDEDWQMQQWGRDEIALAARAYRHAEMQAAATVLRLSKARPFLFTSPRKRGEKERATRLLKNVSQSFRTPP
jgi:chaperone required for assembly of F1-ATPase